MYQSSISPSAYDGYQDGLSLYTAFAPNFYDPFGEAGPAVPVVAAIAAVVVACGLPWHNYAHNNYSHKSDDWLHCYVSCQMAKTCGASLAQLAGLGKEVIDRAKAFYCEENPDSDLCRGGHGYFWDSLDDLASNQECIPFESYYGFGLTCRLWRASCKECCDEKVK